MFLSSLALAFSGALFLGVGVAAAADCSMPYNGDVDITVNCSLQPGTYTVHSFKIEPSKYVNLSGLTTAGNIIINSSNGVNILGALYNTFGYAGGAVLAAGSGPGPGGGGTYGGGGGGHGGAGGAGYEGAGTGGAGGIANDSTTAPYDMGSGGGGSGSGSGGGGRGGGFIEINDPTSISIGAPNSSGLINVAGNSGSTGSGDGSGGGGAGGTIYLVTHALYCNEGTSIFQRLKADGGAAVGSDAGGGGGGGGIIVEDADINDCPTTQGTAVTAKGGAGGGPWGLPAPAATSTASPCTPSPSRPPAACLNTSPTASPGPLPAPTSPITAFRTRPTAVRGRS